MELHAVILPFEKAFLEQIMANHVEFAPHIYADDVQVFHIRIDQGKTEY